MKSDSAVDRQWRLVAVTTGSCFTVISAIITTNSPHHLWQWSRSGPQLCRHNLDSADCNEPVTVVTNGFNTGYYTILYWVCTRIGHTTDTEHTDLTYRDTTAPAGTRDSYLKNWLIILGLGVKHLSSHEIQELFLTEAAKPDRTYGFAAASNVVVPIAVSNTKVSNVHELLFILYVIA